MRRDPDIKLPESTTEVTDATELLLWIARWA